MKFFESLLLLMAIAVLIPLPNSGVEKSYFGIFEAIVSLSLFMTSRYLRWREVRSYHWLILWELLLFSVYLWLLHTSLLLTVG